MARNVRSNPSCYGTCLAFPNRRVFTGMPVSPRTVRIMRHVIAQGERYGKLAVIAEVHKTGADGRRYRAALCQCDCGKHVTPRISSPKSGDARSCGCSRGLPKAAWRHCPVCGTLAMIRRDHRSCSPGCGHQLARFVRFGTPTGPTAAGCVLFLRQRAVAAAIRRDGRGTLVPGCAENRINCFLAATDLGQGS